MLESTPNKVVVYTRSKMPMFLSDRELIFQIDKYPQQDGTLLYTTRSIEHPECPATGDAVRIQVFKASLVSNEGSNLRLIEYQHMDVGGYVPASLMNMVMGSMLSRGLERFKMEMQEKQAIINRKNSNFKV